MNININTEKQYKPKDILGLMSDLITNRLSEGYWIDFEQQLYIRDCSHIEDVVGESYMVQTSYIESVVTYIVGDFDNCNQYVYIMERHFEPSAIDDETFNEVEEVPVAKFKPDQYGTYTLKGIRFNL